MLNWKAVLCAAGRSRVRTRLGRYTWKPGGSLNVWNSKFAYFFTTCLLGVANFVLGVVSCQVDYNIWDVSTYSICKGVGACHDYEKLHHFPKMWRLAHRDFMSSNWNAGCIGAARGSLRKWDSARISSNLHCACFRHSRLIGILSVI